MTYGVILRNALGTVDTKKDYGLILCSDLSISMPEPRYRFVDVPERDGVIDLSEVLTDRMTYSQRAITFSLFAESDVIRGTDKPPNERVFLELKARFANAYHGKQVEIRFPDDPDSNFYYTGRLTVGEKSGYNSGKIPITVTAQPYRLGNSHSETLTGQDVLWIDNYGTDVYPVLTASGSDAILVVNDSLFYVPEGRSASPEPLINGVNTIEKDPEVSTAVTIQMEWQERKF